MKSISTDHQTGIVHTIQTKDRVLVKETWELDGQLHRTDGPAIIEYCENGQIWRTGWFFDGMDHREDGPALNEYHENGKKLEEWWCLDGSPHRTDGPAYNKYDRAGKLIKEYWWIKGKAYALERLQKIVGDKDINSVDGRTFLRLYFSE